MCACVHVCAHTCVRACASHAYAHMRASRIFRAASGLPPPSHIRVCVHTCGVRTATVRAHAIVHMCMCHAPPTRPQGTIPYMYACGLSARPDLIRLIRTRTHVICRRDQITLGSFACARELARVPVWGHASPCAHRRVCAWTRANVRALALACVDMQRCMQMTHDVCTEMNAERVPACVCAWGGEAFRGSPLGRMVEPNLTAAAGRWYLGALPIGVQGKQHTAQAPVRPSAIRTLRVYGDRPQPSVASPPQAAGAHL